MRVSLLDLAPKWLGPSGDRLGFDFLCPACGRHRQEVWLLKEGCVTAAPDRPLFESFGSTLDNLTLRDGLECGEDWMFIRLGHVVVG